MKAAMPQSLEEWRGEISADVRYVRKQVEHVPAQIDRLGDRLEEALATHSDSNKTTHEDHERRIAVIEKTVVKYGVLVAIGSAVFGVVATAWAHTYFGG